MILHDYVRLLLHRWWLVLGCAVLGGGIAAALTLASPPTYYTQATVYVAINGTDTPSDLQQGAVFTVQRVATYAGLATTDAVLSRAAADLDDDTDVDDLRGVITAVGREQAALIDISATGNEPDRITEQANAVAGALATQAPLLDAPGSTSPVQLTVVQPAEVPENPFTPRPRNNVMIGTLVGLLIGVGLLVVLDALNTRIRSLRDLPQSPTVATVTSIPSGPPRFRRPTASDVRLEAFRNLRANLQFGSHIGGGALALAGISAASDVQAIARQLGAALAETGSKVVIVDVDFRHAGRRHRQRGTAGQAPASGVADILGGRISLEEVLVPSSGVPNSWEIPSGSLDPSSAQLLSTPATRRLLDELKARFDFVLVVTPPLVERSESAVVAALADSTLLVIESGSTKQADFLLALERLAGVRVTSVSVAIDHVHPSDLGVRSSWLTDGPVAV